MIWKQKFMLLTVWLVLSAVGVGVVLLIPATYKAETLILVDSQKIPEKFVSATVNADLQDRIATISQQILSSSRLLKIIDTFGLYKEERKSKVQEEILEMMKSDIKIKAETGWVNNRPGAFRVGFQGPDRNVVAEVANQLGNLFVEENLRARETYAEGTADFMKSQLEQAKRNLDELEQKVSAYKMQHSGQLPQQENALVSALARLQIELQSNQDAIHRAQQTKMLLESSLSVSQANEARIARATEAAALVQENLPAAAKPKKESEQLQAQLDALLVRYRDDHPDVREVKEKLVIAKASEAKEEATGKPQAAAAAAAALGKIDRNALQEKERISSLQTQLNTITKEVEFRNQQQQKILKEINSYQSRVEGLPMREQELAQVSRDYEISKLNYKSVLDKIFAAQMATEMERRQKAERFVVLDPARVPEKPYKPDRVLLGWIFCGVALVLAVAAAVAREMRKNSVLGEWELPAHVVILGRVPHIEGA
jgi:protein tyrosine kinase modulator